MSQVLAISPFPPYPCEIQIQKCVHRKEKIILRITFIPRTQEFVIEGLYQGSFTPLGLIFNDTGRTQETEWRQLLNQAVFRSIYFTAELTTSLNPPSPMRTSELLTTFPLFCAAQPSALVNRLVHTANPGGASSHVIP